MRGRTFSKNRRKNWKNRAKKLTQKNENGVLLGNMFKVLAEAFGDDDCGKATQINESRRDGKRKRRFTKSRNSVSHDPRQEEDPGDEIEDLL